MIPTRPLDAVELRVLGALMEKEQTTPDAYPLTINGVIAACNQKSNREPVTSLSETEVVEALDRLREDVLTWRVEGPRAERWEHRLDRRWQLDGGSKAVMTLLLLRGPQTPGELRTRSNRMHDFDDPAAVEAVLEELADREAPLVVQLPRRSGQREARWAHLVGDVAVDVESPAAPTAAADPLAPAGAPAVPDPPARSSWQMTLEQALERITALEAEVATLRAAVGEMREGLGLDPLPPPASGDDADGG